MNQNKQKLINSALDLYDEIYPCADKSELADCFTTEGHLLLFWFNTKDSSTHVMSTNLNER